MGVFEAIGTDTHEEVTFGIDHPSGLRTIIAIHSTALGPALGGTRFFPYASEEDALVDVLRLSRGMTYKSAAAGLDLGGGKAVIIGDPRTMKSERLLRAYAGVVDSLGGRYITAEDVGTTMDDMAIIRRGTRHVAGLPSTFGGSGDPSPATARGVQRAMEAVADTIWGSRDLAGRRIAVQGVGKVGMSLVERLTAVGAEIVVADVDPAAVDRAVDAHCAKPVEMDDVYGVDCDIFSPCALGATLNEHTIPLLRCAAVVGSANNQLAVAEDAVRLQGREILYAPDFVANAGGVINIAAESQSYSAQRAASMVDAIYDNVKAVLQRAAAEGINARDAAERVAEERIEAVGSLRLRAGATG
ncbi:MAG: Glu/Leu/Phe/Val dehydrogenase [Actinobacteria bacterium]|nr:MAG: Glu/Leu/Phe/Val dehydrogenase [Actinomycetota bacterium]